MKLTIKKNEAQEELDTINKKKNKAKREPDEFNTETLTVLCERLKQKNDKDQEKLKEQIKEIESDIKELKNKFQESRQPFQSALDTNCGGGILTKMYNEVLETVERIMECLGNRANQRNNGSVSYNLEQPKSPSLSSLNTNVPPRPCCSTSRYNKITLPPIHFNLYVNSHVTNNFSQ